MVDGYKVYRWIKCDDRLPDVGNNVLTFCREYINGELKKAEPIIAANTFYGIEKGEVDCELWGTDTYRTDEYELRVVAWRDLPEDFKENHIYIPFSDKDKVKEEA